MTASIFRTHQKSELIQTTTFSSFELGGTKRRRLKIHRVKKPLLLIQPATVAAINSSGATFFFPHSKLLTLHIYSSISLTPPLHHHRNSQLIPSPVFPSAIVPLFQRHRCQNAGENHNHQYPSVSAGSLLPPNPLVLFLTRGCSFIMTAFPELQGD